MNNYAPPNNCPVCGSDGVRLEINYRFEFQRAYSIDGRDDIYNGATEGEPAERVGIPFEAAIACAECGVETPLDVAMAQAFVDAAQGDEPYSFGDADTPGTDAYNLAHKCDECGAVMTADDDGMYCEMCSGENDPSTTAEEN